MTTMALNALRSLRLLRMPPAVRASIGLSALLISCLLFLDMFFTLIPDQSGLQRQLRERTSENLSIQIAVLMQSGNSRAINHTLSAALARDKTMRSIGIRGTEGNIVLQFGDHARHWVPPPPGVSTIDHVRVPLLVDNRRWGDVEISFEPMYPAGWRGIFAHPLVLLVLGLGFGGFVLFSLYLRRVFQHLDPSAVIPERVRAAFDAFSEGVMVLDAGGRIMLANTALRGWVGQGGMSLYGRTAQEIPAFQAALPANHMEYPWVRAMAERAPMKGDYLEFARTSDVPIKVTINCAPIFDGRRDLRGCIVTFSDITDLEQANRKLKGTIEELAESKSQIERQNEELRRLATRDPLTGCLNRRSFFEKLDTMFVAAKNGAGSLCCIMTDIDHFKTFNDRYGHAMGDHVLQVVARSLFSGLREADLLCRYGGEEFCIILPAVDERQAAAVAERLRSEIEEYAGKGIRSTQGIRVTSSFGMAFLSPDIADPAEMIERADQALYAAKNGGRNCVAVWQEKPVA